MRLGDLEVAPAAVVGNRLQLGHRRYRRRDGDDVDRHATPGRHREERRGDALGGGQMSARALSAARDEHRDGVTALGVQSGEPRGLGPHIIEQVRQGRIVDAERVVAGWQQCRRREWLRQDRPDRGVRTGVVRPDQWRRRRLDTAVVAIHDAAEQLPVAHPNAVGWQLLAGVGVVHGAIGGRHDMRVGLAHLQQAEPDRRGVLGDDLVERRRCDCQPGLLEKAVIRRRHRVADDRDACGVELLRRRRAPLQPLIHTAKARGRVSRGDAKRDVPHVAPNVLGRIVVVAVGVVLHPRRHVDGDQHVGAVLRRRDARQRSLQQQQRVELRFSRLGPADDGKHQQQSEHAAARCARRDPGKGGVQW